MNRSFDKHFHINVSNFHGNIHNANILSYLILCHTLCTERYFSMKCGKSLKTKKKHTHLLDDIEDVVELLLVTTVTPFFVRLFSAAVIVFGRRDISVLEKIY